MLLIKTLNAKGKMFVTSLDKVEVDLNENQDFCNQKFIYTVAEVMNLFLAELYPVYLKELLEEKMKFTFLGFEDDNIKNLILMTKFLANWLFNFDFIEYRLEINVDF